MSDTWQKIDSAPENVTVLVFVPETDLRPEWIGPATKIDGEFFVDDAATHDAHWRTYVVCIPTHWQDRPDAPINW